jgi:predicted aspartyl protease
MRYRYNRQVVPPGPYVHVKVGRVDAIETTVIVPALIDSGADRTVIPMSLARDLALAQAGVIEARGLNQISSTMPVYVVRIGIADVPMVPIDVLGADGEPYVLLGRDVLNRYHITLDGPQLLCTIELQ